MLRLYHGYGRDNYGPELGFNRSHSQFDLPSFGLDPDSPIFLQPGYGPGGLPLNIYRGNSRRDQLLSERMEWYKPRSLGNLAVDLDTFSIWSGQYDNRPDFDGFDRKYRAASMGNLNIGYSGDWRESRGGGEVGSKQSLGQISGVSDNPEKYRDIAL
ncbi:uncharacterized protein LOC111716336 [Eurytemora carolleeae]|uniref:uncharacterized protein LOC111716336 n=1 Tax=Eurytemora carolleeae TaxID=1294199 RepID=UPI000C763B52|nr:uncharacterized protein LOC111716336 [Eurytemora carolleeae]|eukprot:XP_023347541.1 uncharacterized protein LOC111716336 [Eurytemora affinis]